MYVHKRFFYFYKNLGAFLKPYILVCVERPFGWSNGQFFFFDKRNRKPEGSAKLSETYISLGGASEGGVRAHMGTGTTRT